MTGSAASDAPVTLQRRFLEIESRLRGHSMRLSFADLDSADQLTAFLKTDARSST